MGDVTAEFRDLFDERGAGVAELLVGHDEDRFDARLEVAVHQRHVEFEFEIGKRAEAADDGDGILRDGELDEQVGERGDADVGQVRDVGLDELHALGGGKEGAFARVFGDRNRDTVEELGGASEHVEVPVGDGVERARVKAVAHDVGGGKGNVRDVAMRFFAAGDVERSWSGPRRCRTCAVTRRGRVSPPYNGGAAGVSAIAIGADWRVVGRSSLRMNLPNILTFSRLPAMFAIVALMYAEFQWAATLAFWLFIAAALTDWLDGKVARESGQVSNFGRFMDAVIDKVMVLGVMIALVNGNYFMGHQIEAMIALLCILCREFVVSGLRMAAAAKGIVVEADAGGKLKTFIQLNAIGWLLGSRMFGRDFAELFQGEEAWWVVSVNWIGIGLYALSAVLTITSGATYFRRHGHVVMS